MARKALKVKSAVFLFLLLLVFCGCQGMPSIPSLFQEPKVSINSVNVAGFNLSGLNLIANLDVENPNGFSVPMPKVDWVLFINNSSLTQGTVEEDRTIGSREKISLAVPVSVGTDQIIRTVGSLIGFLGAGSRQLPYKIEMGISFPFPLLENIVYPLTYEGVLPVPSL